MKGFFKKWWCGRTTGEKLNFFERLDRIPWEKDLNISDSFNQRKEVEFIWEGDNAREREAFGGERK